MQSNKFKTLLIPTFLILLETLSLQSEANDIKELNLQNLLIGRTFLGSGSNYGSLVDVTFNSKESMDHLAPKNYCVIRKTFRETSSVVTDSCSWWVTGDVVNIIFNLYPKIPIHNPEITRYKFGSDERKITKSSKSQPSELTSSTVTRLILTSSEPNSLAQTLVHRQEAPSDSAPAPATSARSCYRP